MMSPQHEVLDISSDDDEAELGFGERPDWLASLLEKDDSDEVIVISEVPGSQEQSSKLSMKEDLDDDCLILNGDPDKPVEVENDAGNESDELQVVGEKGQVACRDYPHPRHLCANFPFSVNPHEKHCDLCHCYVCDTRAPCIYWGTGASTTDHCHSNDKEEVWKVQRKLFKHGATKASLPPPKHPVHKPTTPSPVLQPPNHRINAMNVPNIISQRSHHHRRLLRPLPPASSRSASVPSGSSSIVNNNIVHQRHKSSTGTTLAPSHTNFKRVGATTITKNGPGQVCHTSCRNHPTTTSLGQSTRSHLLQPCLQQMKNHPSVTYHAVPVPQQINNGVQIPRPQQQRKIHTHTPVTYNGVPSPRPQVVNISQPHMSTGLVNSPLLPQVSENQNPYLLHVNSSPPPPQPPPPPPAGGGTVVNQNILDIPLNWLGDTVETFAPPLQNSEVPSLIGTTTTTTTPQAAPGDFDIDSWIQSMDEPGKESISSGLGGFVPTQSELSEAMLLFDFENPYMNL